MILVAALTITFLHAGPAERVYRVATSAPAGSQITLRVNPPAGWIAAFCTASVCSRGSVTAPVPLSGTLHADLHLYENGRPQRGSALVTDNRGERGRIRVPTHGG